MVNGTATRVDEDALKARLSDEGAWSVPVSGWSRGAFSPNVGVPLHLSLVAARLQPSSNLALWAITSYGISEFSY